MPDFMAEQERIAQEHRAMGGDDITLGELGRALHQFRTDYLRDQAEAKKSRDELRHMVEHLQFVSPAVYSAHRESDLRRIEALEMDNLNSIQDRKTLGRQVLGLAITAVISIVTVVITFILNAL